jgi:hypothetical protein
MNKEHIEVLKLMLQESKEVANSIKELFLRQEKIYEILENLSNGCEIEGDVEAIIKNMNENKISYTHRLVLKEYSEELIKDGWEVMKGETNE